MIAQTERLEQIETLHEEGHSLREIARRVGVSKSQVERDLRNREASPVATPEPTSVQRDQTAAVRRVNALASRARAFMRSELAWRFLDALQLLHHVSTASAGKRLAQAGGTVRDSLIGTASWIDQDDLDAIAAEVDRLVTNDLQKRADRLKREHERVVAELDAWRRFMRGDIDE